MIVTYPETGGALFFQIDTNKEFAVIIRVVPGLSISAFVDVFTPNLSAVN